MNSLNASRIANSSVEFHLRLEEVVEESELLARNFMFHSSVISSDVASGIVASLSGMSFFLRYVTRFSKWLLLYDVVWRNKRISSRLDNEQKVHFKGGESKEGLYLLI